MFTWYLKNLLFDLIGVRRTENERLEWHHFMSVEFPYWLESLWFVRAFQQCVHWTLALVAKALEVTAIILVFVNVVCVVARASASNANRYAALNVTYKCNKCGQMSFPDLPNEFTISEFLTDIIEKMEDNDNPN